MTRTYQRRSAGARGRDEAADRRGGGCAAHERGAGPYLDRGGRARGRGATPHRVRPLSRRAALFVACGATGRYSPVSGRGSWSRVADPHRRLQRALRRSTAGTKMSGDDIELFIRDAASSPPSRPSGRRGRSGSGIRPTRLGRAPLGRLARTSASRRRPRARLRDLALARPPEGLTTGGRARDVTFVEKRQPSRDVRLPRWADDRRETESGIELKPVYTAADVAGRARAPGRVSVHARALPDDVPRAAVDDPPVRRLRLRGGDERALPLPARARPDRPLDRVRPADPARLRLRRPARARRGRPHRRRDRLARRHGAPLRRDPARRGVHVDDDQRAGVAAAAPVRARRRGAGRPRRPRCAAPSRTTSSRSTSRAGTTSSRRGRPCGSPPTSSPTAPSGCRASTRSRSPGTTSARPARPRSRRSPSRSPTGSPMRVRRRRRGSRPTSSASGSPSSSTRTTTSSRRWRSSGRRGGCGRSSSASGSG